VVANLVGALLDLLIQMFALFFLAAGIVPLLRGSAGGLLFLLGGAALLAVLIRRVVRREYVFSVRAPGRVDLHVDTASVPYFVLDLMWLVFGVSWLVGPGSTVPDPAFDLGSPLIILVTVAVLAGLRIRARAVGATRR
jgi:hypothetical protein